MAEWLSPRGPRTIEVYLGRASSEGLKEVKMEKVEK